jgi:hypothetical protein
VVIGEEKVNFKYAFIGAAVVSHHQSQFSLKVDPQNLSQTQRGAALNLEVQFIAAPDPTV